MWQRIWAYLAVKGFSVSTTFAAGEELDLQLVDVNHIHRDERLW